MQLEQLTEQSFVIKTRHQLLITRVKHPIVFLRIYKMTTKKYESLIITKIPMKCSAE